MQWLYPGLFLGASLVFTPSINAANEPTKTDSFSLKLIPKLIIANNSETIEQNSTGSLLEQLNLTPRQQGQIRKIHHRYQSKISRLKQDLQLAQQQLSSMMAGTDSADLVRAKHQQIANFRQQLGALHFESMLATREILTPTQRQKFIEIIESD